MTAYRHIEPPPETLVATLDSPGYRMRRPTIVHADRIPPETFALLDNIWSQAEHGPCPVRLYRLRDVFVSGEGTVFDRSLDVVAPSVTQQSPEHIEIARTALEAAVASGTVRRIGGSQVLCYKPGWGNIGHWLLEMLPAAWFGSRLFGKPCGILKPTSGPAMREAVDESLRLIGIEQDRTIAIDWQEPVWVEELLLLEGLTRHSVHMSPLVFEPLDHLAAQVPTFASADLYVRRDQPAYRRFVDDEQICRLLAERGFRYFNPSTTDFATGVAAFKAAPSVFGTASAALSRICFSRPGSALTVFYPATMADTFFWFICQHRDIDFVDVRCVQAGPSETFLPWDSDLEIEHAEMAGLAAQAVLRRSHKTDGSLLRDRPHLIDIAQRHGTDKHGEHRYAQHYHHHFAPLRDRPVRLLEIGIGGYEDPHRGGASLRAWKEFFPHGRIAGLDIVDKSPHAEDRIAIFQGSQDDAVLLNRISAEAGPFDIIIDDGSHICSHVIDSFRHLFPLLADGGIYVAEDIQTSYWGYFGGSSRDLNDQKTSMGFMKNLIDGLNHEEYDMPNYDPTYLDRHIVSMHFYHNMVFIYKGFNNEGSNVARNNILPDHLRQP